MNPIHPQTLTARVEHFLRQTAGQELQVRKDALRDQINSAESGIGAIFAEISDECLALAIQKDFFAAEAFEELCARRYAGQLKMWFRRQGARPEDVDDLVQTLWVRIWKTRLRSYSAEIPFGRYLWQVARHCFVDFARRKRSDVRLNELSGLPAMEQSSEEAANANELKELLALAIQRLSEPMRHVLQAYAEGQSFEFIAKELRVTRTAVSKSIVRARRCLEQVLGLPLERARIGRVATCGEQLPDNLRHNRSVRKQRSLNDPGQTAPVVDDTAPEYFGHYRVEQMLGQGCYGVVYLARDEQLQRLVAIKVPHHGLVSRPEDADAYLAEARTIACLDHPHIVPVYDVGSMGQFPCYIVSKYIEGINLAAKLKQTRLSLHEAVELVATVAEALHLAHERGLVHRDVKPSNILFDLNRKPFVCDFGLAFRATDIGNTSGYVGTPAYISPEQARGEGHRVDGRSDIFSLGVVLYELLAGRRPFGAELQWKLLEQIINQEARPLRQIDESIPKELDRICLKALSKRAADRYSAAKNLADDLRHFLGKASAEEMSTVTGREAHRGDSAVKIVPKGLRSFDAGDADYILGLLPGPRDRDGLPESIGVWKTRIEATDPDSTFPVGVLYGSPGCGKSSLVKACLLPMLARSVTAVYIEATGKETEARLLKGLRRQVPGLPDNLSLVDSLTAVRQLHFLEPNRKVLLVLDQFEQWLHVRCHEERTELVKALRQCDGGRVQAVVMVRDDVWLGVSRFMQELETRVVEGENYWCVDRFDSRHDGNVSTAFAATIGLEASRSGAFEEGAFSESATAKLAQHEANESIRQLYLRLGLTSTDSSLPSEIKWSEFEQLLFGWEEDTSRL